MTTDNPPLDLGVRGGKAGRSHELVEADAAASPGPDVEQGDVVPPVPAGAAQRDELLVSDYQADLERERQPLGHSDNSTLGLVQLGKLHSCSSQPSGGPGIQQSADIKTRETHLECLLAGVSASHEVVADPDKPVAVPVPVVEAVGGGDQDPGGEDGGGAHEVGLPAGLAEEERGQPGETSLCWRVGSLALLVGPDDPTSPGSLVWSNTGHLTNIIWVQTETINHYWNYRVFSIDKYLVW